MLKIEVPSFYEKWVFCQYRTLPQHSRLGPAGIPLFSFVRNQVLRPLKDKPSQLIFIFIRKYTCINSDRPDKIVSTKNFLAFEEWNDTMNQNGIGAIEMILLVNFESNFKTSFILDSVVLQVLIMCLYIVFV